MLRILAVSSALVSVCVVIHIIGLVLLAKRLIRLRPRTQSEFGTTRVSVLLISVFAIIIILHLAETLVWASFYDLSSLFADFETSWYFSVGTYTTIGYGDVLLPAKWRMLGGLEGITGVLICGLSTAFLFTVSNQLFAGRMQQRAARSERDVSTSNL